MASLAVGHSGTRGAGMAKMAALILASNWQPGVGRVEYSEGANRV